MNEYETIIDEFLAFESKKAYLEEIGNPTSVFRLMIELNLVLASTGKSVVEAYTDEAEMKAILFEFLPVALVYFVEDEQLSYEVLLDFYEFMYLRSYLTRSQYLEMLAFFQENKSFYFEKSLSDEMLEISEALLDTDLELLQEFSEFMLDVQRAQALERQSEKQRDNLILFPKKDDSVKE
ncbi:MAG: hypothetical protein ACK5MW_05040 [Enterococcus sp.]